MPRDKLDPQLKEIRRQTNLSFPEIIENSLVEYISRYDFETARKVEAQNRKKIIRYAIKKHGENAKKVLYKQRIPIAKNELEFYHEALAERWKAKPIKQPLRKNKIRLG